MRVLSAHAGADTGGVGYGMAGAFARADTTVDFRSTVRTSNYIRYPDDLRWNLALTYARKADVLHLHNTMRTAVILAATGKPRVLHHHGTHYRDNADRLNAEVEAVGARAVVSTLDLLDYGPDLTWVPAAYDLPALERIRTDHGRRWPHVSGDPIRVGHAPTDRAIKSTDAFLAACEKIPGVEPVLIEKAAWSACLRVKAKCDVYFDQVQLGYGCNAIEAWGMGIPVICGASSRTLGRMADTFGQLPFRVADETTIGDAIKAMLDYDVRQAYADQGLLHVLRWHDGRETVRRLTPIYEALCST